MSHIEDQKLLISANISIAKYFLNSCDLAYYCNLSDGTVRILQEFGVKVNDSEEKFISFSNSVLAHIDKYVHPDDKQYVKDKLVPQNVREILRSTDSYSFDFRDIARKKISNYRCVVLQGEDKEHATFIFWDITEDLSKELERTEREKMHHILIENNERIMALEDDFKSLYDLDLETGHYEHYIKKQVSGDSVYSHMVNTTDFFSDTLENAERIVFPDDREDIIRILKKEFILKTLEKERYFDWFYRLNIGSSPQWVKMRFLYKNAEKRHIIVGVFDAEAEMAAKQRDEQLRKELIERMAGEDGVFLIDCVNDRRKTLHDRLQGLMSFGDEDNYSHLVELYVSQYIAEPDRERMLKMMSIPYMQERLLEEKEFTVRYRDTTAGIQHFFEMRVMRFSENEILQSFSEKDEEVVNQMVFNMLREEFFAILGADLETGYIQVFKNSSWRDMGETGLVAPYTPYMKEFASSFNGEAKDFFEKISDIGYLKERLAKEDRFTYTFKSKWADETKWITATEMVLARGKDDSPTIFALGFSILDADASQKEELQIKLKTDMQMIDGLASGYHTLYFLNIDENLFKIYSIDGQRFPEARQYVWEDGAPEKMLQNYGSSELIHPDDRHLFSEITIDYIRKRLSHSKKHTIRFRRKYGEEYLWAEMDIIKHEDDDEQANAIAIGFAVRDAEIRGEQAQTRCFSILNKDISPDDAINELMTLAGEFYGATRAYIFEFQQNKTVFSNTHEWCAPGVEPMRAKLQNIPYKEVVGWVKEFERQGAFYMDSLDTEHNTEEGIALLAMQGIQSLIAAPIVSDDEIVGFVGVDDPTKAKGNIHILKNVAVVSYSEILKRKHTEISLYESAKSFADTFLESYVSAYYVNLLDRSVVVFNRTHDLEESFGHITDYLASINRYINECVHPEDQEKMFEAVQPEYIRERLKEEKSFSTYIRDISGEETRWYYFEVTRGSDENHAGFAFSDVTEELIQQQEEQQQLQKDLEIIQALASDYSSVYYIDLESEKVTPYALDESIGNKITEILKTNEKFSEVYVACIKQFVYEPDQEALLRESKKKIVLEKLSQSNSYTLRFRRMDEEGAILFSEMKFVVAHRENGIVKSLALGLAYKDEAIMAEYINGKLIQEYISAFMVDLSHDRYRIYRHPDTTQAMDRKDRIWSAAMADFAAECEPEYYELVKNIGNPEFLKKELADVDRREFLYRCPTTSKPWRRSVILVLDRENGVPNTVVATFMGIDDYQSKIQDQQKQLKIQQDQMRKNMEVIGGLASEYLALYYVNLREDLLNVYTVDEGRLADTKKLLTEDNDPFALIRRFAQSPAVHPDDQYLFQNLTKENIIKRLDGTKKFSIRFRRNYGKGFLWSVMDVVKSEQVDEEANAITIGFAERDKEIRREQERAIEKDLANQQRHIKAFGDMVNAALWSIDLDREDKIIGIVWSDEFRRMLGYENTDDFPNTEEALLTKIHPDDVQRAQRNFQESIQSVKTEEMTYDICYRVLRKTGEYCWYHAVGRMEDNSDGTRRIYGIITDISANKKLERQLALSDGLAREYHTVWLVDGWGEHRLHLFRSTGKKTIQSAVQRGLDEPTYDSTMLKYVMASVHEDDRERVLEASRFETVVRETPDVGTYVVSYKRYFDEQGHVDYHQMCFAKAVTDDGTVSYILAFRDADQMLREQIAQQEQLEEALSMAQSANRAKTTFLNNMSHDMRTPMNAIIGFSGLAVKHIDNKEQVQDYLTKIEQSSNHLLSLINDVLDMSRIESGKAHLDEVEENLSDIIHTLEDIVQADMQKKQHTFTLRIDPLTDENIVCDRLRLSQVLLNILSNSIKYTPAGGQISMYVTEKGTKPSGYATYEFRIQDNGMGMSEEFLKTIFEPFTRVKSSTVSGIQGTGLGMAITKNIIDMMGGTIDVKSELGKGTETTLTFDFMLQPTSSTTSASESTDNTYFSLKGKKILLVEDNELNREIATTILEEYGCQITPAEDGSIAVQKMKEAKRGEYDLILMDIQMPIMDGYEATRQIRESEKTIPIIAMTANAFEEDRKLALQAGMNEHIAKPIDIDQLKDILSEFL